MKKNSLSPLMTLPHLHITPDPLLLLPSTGPDFPDPFLSAPNIELFSFSVLHPTQALTPPHLLTSPFPWTHILPTTPKPCPTMT
ncbi:unnamed protein product [Prunus brigantina]